jgi:hypothetical protein
VCPSAPLMGAFININSSSVTSFNVQPPTDYLRPSGLASCMGVIQGEAQWAEAACCNHMYVSCFCMHAPGMSLLQVLYSSPEPFWTHLAAECWEALALFDCHLCLYPCHHHLGAGPLFSIHQVPQCTLKPVAAGL